LIIAKVKLGRHGFSIALWAGGIGVAKSDSAADIYASFFCNPVGQTMTVSGENKQS
jgi:hypothetical protein